jgi:hypothetical protein
MSTVLRLYLGWRLLRLFRPVLRAGPVVAATSTLYLGQAPCEQVSKGRGPGWCRSVAKPAAGARARVRTRTGGRRHEAISASSTGLDHCGIARRESRLSSNEVRFACNADGWGDRIARGPTLA